MTNERLVHRNGAFGGETMINERLVHGNRASGGETKDNDDGYKKYDGRSSTAAEGNGGDQVPVLR